ncbi:MAG TPA: circadian clock protein KaiC [Jatrophihabitans sp.]|uniref:circadian clock protein KaiC n=1 Tax=Jatrophihabitans sp. TaxID=1932789 RepID=UPI002E06F9CD|nr:circadian clock protein KaiC [Jatrophihabitans sp.]
MLVDAVLKKIPSGITGLDEMTGGGLPGGRPTLVCGTAGCGKTMLGLQFLVRGALDHDEPGVFVSFEESPADLAANVASVGWDLVDMQQRGQLVVEYVRVEPARIQEAGEYDLEGLFLRLGAAVDAIGAQRVVIDTLEVLFAALTDQATLRSELRRLFRWLKDRGLTAVVTAESGDGTLTRHGLEEYVSDCVIFLDHRVTSQVSTRRLRVVKYRGSSHDTDETPFMIDTNGFRVLPAGSMRLEHDAPKERVSSGVPRLDTMLGGAGYFRGGSVLITGTPGTGKTTLAAAFLAAGCERGERAILFSFEESPQQLIRNLGSVSIELEPHLRAGLLRVVATRPTAHGLEAHLATLMHAAEEHVPQLVVVDPVSAFDAAHEGRTAMLIRLIDWLKQRTVTAVFTSLSSSEDDDAHLGVSSVIDAWLSLETVESNGERNRSLRVVKARGTGHSNQVRELLITDAGLELVDVYTGSGAVVMGTARQIREAADAAEVTDRRERTEMRRRDIERRRRRVEAEVAALQADLAAEVAALERELGADARSAAQRASDAGRLRQARHADGTGAP